jgi:single-strand DNA-binding protein
MNLAVISGNLTKEPERFGTQESVAKFTIAVNDGQQAEFIPCTAFKKTADLVLQYLNKGSKCIVTGRIHNNDYTDKKGESRRITEILVDRVEFLSKKESDAPFPEAEGKRTEPLQGQLVTDKVELPPVDNSDLPF